MNIEKGNAMLPPRGAPTTVGVFRSLFLAGLILISLLALGFDSLLAPSPIVVGLGVASFLAGGGILILGNRSKGSAIPRSENVETEAPVEAEPRRSPGCLAIIVGSLYLFAGVWIFVMQAIGYFGSR
jgi:hypothetical protein